MHSLSGNFEPRQKLLSNRCPEFNVAPVARRTLSVLLGTLVIFAAGCHRNNNLTSGYGLAWVTLTAAPSDFTSYIVIVDSLMLTRSDGTTVIPLQTPETVDFSKLDNLSELWGTATLQVGTYQSATLTLDYTNAFISVMVNGLPQKATVVDAAGASVTKQTINVTLDPANPLVVPATYATTSAQRLALEFNLAASTGTINFATTPTSVTIKPYLTLAIAPMDNKPIRIRGPLINSSSILGTYTVNVQPFYDVGTRSASLSLFTTPSTIFAINGTVSTGTPGITQLSQSSIGSTMTAAYTTFLPTPTPGATAGKFTALYVVAGSTLEDTYTQGLEGDVVARTGNTLTLRGSTLSFDNGTLPSYYVADATVIIGPSTLVTADNTTLTDLNYNSVAVGQHIVARGLASQPASNVVALDATGAKNTNTGSVRLISTSLWGSLVSTTTGNVSLNLQTINNWPVADYAFAGNGTSAATNPVATNFSVNSAALAIPDTTVGDPLWIDGLFAPFGTAPPDFTALSVNDELSVQAAGAAAAPTIPLSCGQGNSDCVRASMQVSWTGSGTSTPFTGLSSSGFSVDLNNANFGSGVIRIGPESIALKSLAQSPNIVPTAAPAPVTANAGSSGSVTVTLPPLYLPSYSFGTPATAAPNNVVSVFSAFGTFATQLTTALAAKPALQLEARGTFNRASNTFNAISVNVVL